MMINTSSPTPFESLPENWKIVSLGDLDYFKIIKSGVSRFEGTKDYLSTSSIQGLTIASIESQVTYKERPSRANMQPRVGSVWFAQMANTIKVYAFTDVNTSETSRFILSTGFCGISVNRNEVNADYLKYIFLSRYFNTSKDSLSSGSTQKAINNANIGKILIPLPPLCEQQIIAKILSTVRQAIDATDRVIDAARELKRSMMRHLFTYGPVPVQEADQVKLKETEVGEVSEDWHIDMIRNLADIQYGYQTSIPKNPPPGGIEIISTAEIKNDGLLDLSKIRKVDVPDKYISKYVLQKDDVLFNWRNAQNLVGKTAIVDFEPTYEIIYASFILRVRANDLLLPQYLYYLLNELHHRNVFFTLSRRAVNQANYNANQLGDLLISYPSRYLQCIIANILVVLDKKINIENQKKSNLEAIFDSLLHHLMTGKIRIPYEQ